MPPSRRRRASEPSLPLVPVLVGVIVAGLAIGALFSTFGSHGSGGDAGPAATPVPAVALATPTPEPPARALPTPRPAVATPIPRRRLRTPEPTPPPTPTPDPDATPSPTPTDSPTPEPTLPPTPRPTRRPTPRPTLRPIRATAAPETGGGVSVEPTDAPIPAAGPPDPGATGFPHEAELLVRRYYAALRAGDPAEAYAALGAPVGGGRGRASTAPEAMVGPETRILHIEARGGSDASAVDVNFRADGATYFGHYVVERTPSGPVIRSHEVIRP